MSLAVPPEAEGNPALSLLAVKAVKPPALLAEAAVSTRVLAVLGVNYGDAVVQAHVVRTLVDLDGATLRVHPVRVSPAEELRSRR